MIRCWSRWELDVRVELYIFGESCMLTVPRCLLVGAFATDSFATGPCGAGQLWQWTVVVRGAGRIELTWSVSDVECF